MNIHKKIILIDILFYIMLFFFSLSLIFIHKKDIYFHHTWLIFYWWLTHFVFALFYAFLKIPPAVYHKLLALLKKEYKIILFIAILAFFTRFFLLKSYPYVSIHDELQDAGLFALRIKRGEIKDFFDFGNFQGYGNFIPLISYFFWPIFQNTPLLYRVPSAIFGILSIVLTFIIAKKIAGRKTAIASSLFLIGSLLHLHYSRTELLVILDSFLAALIILAVYSAFFYREGFLLAGLTIGFSLHFYAGIRGIVLASVVYLFLANMIKIISFLQRLRHPRGDRNGLPEGVRLTKSLTEGIKKTIICLLLFSLGFFISLGPRINRINAQNSYSQTGQTNLIFADQSFKAKNWLNKIDYLLNLYEKSFLTHTFEPAIDFHFSYNQKALLPSPLNWFFLIGLFYLLFLAVKKNHLINLLLFNIFIFPFTNQVLVNQIGMNHRLMGILPILMIVAGFGLIKLVERIKKISWQNFLLIIIFMFYLSSQLFTFFIGRPSDIDNNRKEKDYIRQYVLEYIKKNNYYKTYYLLEDPAYFSAPHHYCQLDFLTYPKKVILLKKEDFVSRLSQSPTADEKPVIFIYFDELKELNQYNKETIAINCIKRGTFPNYKCPPDSNLSAEQAGKQYQFYLVKK